MSPKTKKKTEKQFEAGPKINWAGALGILFSLPPLLFLHTYFTSYPLPKVIIVNFLWAIFIGALVTNWWSSALHNRIKEYKLSKKVKSNKKPPSKGKPGRIPWIPIWIGIFERLFFVALIGFNLPGAGTFIGAWIGLKLASGWGTWSGGETYGRAVFFIGLLGNAMSLLYSLVPGLVIKAFLYPLGS